LRPKIALPVLALATGRCVMKNNMSKTTSTLILVFVTQLVFAQYQIGIVPRVSPDKATYQKIGYTEVNVKYGSPGAKNRQIWGELVPYNKVWRAGANNATTIEFSSSIAINNMSLDSGKYALFIIPRENDKWTIIFNKTYKQWGAFKYNKNEDALRIDVLPRRTNNQTENLTYSINQVGYKFGSVVLKWDYVEIEVPFETNYLELFEQEIESRANKQPEHIKWVVYLQGAEHLVQINSNDSLALSWVNQAEKIMDATSKWNKQFYPRDYVKGHLYWTKAKLFAQIGSFKKALDYAKKVKTLENPFFYNRKNEVESIDDLINQWKEE
jgi:hypothetical protein